MPYSSSWVVLSALPDVALQRKITKNLLGHWIMYSLWNVPGADSVPGDQDIKMKIRYCPCLHCGQKNKREIVIIAIVEVN